MAPKAKAPRGVVDAAERVAVALEARDVRFALVGGLAVSARVEPRYTRDVDLAVAVASDAEAERLVYELTRRDYVVDTIIEQRKRAQLATARLRPREQPDVFVDLLFASSGIEPEVARGAERVSYGHGTLLPVANVGHLIALKVLSESDERLQDRIDLGMLATVATEQDWRVAEDAVRLIRERGFHRGRALVRRLRRWRRAA